MAYDYGTVMASTRGWPEGWENVLEAIDRHDVYCGEDGKQGLETEPHVTILYGLHEEVHEDLVCRICQSLAEPLEVEVKGVSVFENDEYDVLKFDVDNPLLQKMNKAFRGLPHTNDYEGYNPHMTIAYLKKGTGGKYTDLGKDAPKKIRLPRIDFTPAGEEDSIRIPTH